MAGDHQRRRGRCDAKPYQERDARRAGCGARELIITRKQIKAQAARCAKFVERGDADQCFAGRCPKIMGGGRR